MQEYSKFKTKINGKEIDVLVYDPSKESQTNVKELGSIHHIHVIDRSGSMSGSLDRLIDDVQKIFENIEEEDFLTVIWFSSDNEFRTVVKAAKRSDNIKKLLDGLRTTVGCTCFSDPMKEVGLVVDETLSLCPNILVTLFTDGQPCCNRSYDAEINLTLQHVSNFSNKVLGINTVGYGNYYDQSFLKQISSKSQFGVMVHTKKIDEYFKIFVENKDAVTGMVNKKTEIKSDSEIIYLGPSTCKLGTGTLTQRQRSKTKNLYFVVDPKIVTVDGQNVNLSKITEKTDANIIEDFHYAYAYQMYYENHRKISLRVIAECVGDKKIADMMSNAFTFDECSSVIEGLKSALYKGVRTPNTCGKNYLPADDAPCVLQLLNELAIAEAQYLPFSKNVPSYKRIGRKADESFSTFKNDEKRESVGYFSDLVYNKERLNISIKFTINGCVQLNPIQAKKVNLPETIPTEMFRTHAIVKDGQLNLQIIEVKIPNLTKELIRFIDCGAMVHLEGENFLIHLYNLPIINYAMSNDVGIDKLFDTVYQISELESYQKVVKYHIDQINENGGDEVKKTGVFENLTDEQIKVLEEHGLNDKGWYKGFGGEVAKATESDYYEARLMQFYLKGMSALPSVNKYLTDKAKGKITTISLRMMDSAWKKFEKLNVPSDASVETKELLKNELVEVKKQLNSKRADMNSIRISKALTNDWFPGLKTDDKGNYIYEHKSGETLILRADRTKVYFTADEE